MRIATSLLGGAVALLVVLLLFFQAVAGTLTSELTGALERQDGEVVVYADAARRSPLASVLEPDVAESIAAVDGVRGAAGVRWVPFTIAGQEAVLVGVDPQGPGLPEPVSDGRLPEERGETAVAASAFGADSPELGSTITIDGVPGALTVVGVVDGAVVNALPTYVVTTETVQAAVEARAGAPVPPRASFVAVDVAVDEVLRSPHEQRMQGGVAPPDVREELVPHPWLPELADVGRDLDGRLLGGKGLEVAHAVV